MHRRPCIQRWKCENLRKGFRYRHEIAVYRIPKCDSVKPSAAVNSAGLRDPISLTWNHREFAVNKVLGYQNCLHQARHREHPSRRYPIQVARERGCSKEKTNLTD